MIYRQINRLCSSKLDWAYSGKNKFINSLRLQDYRELYKTTNNGKTNVAVFGNSQVGKTTLILKLLGIKDDCDLHQILRAKKKKGKSVTATTMIYLRSDKEDELFYYKEFDSPEKKLNGNELEENLIKLRSSIEKGSYSLPNILRNSFVTIKIPNHYFTDSKTRLNINIIDLPGINSSNDQEHTYVNELIKRVVLWLDIILLVENSNGFASTLDNFGITEIDRYHYLPDNFRLILTYTFSNNSEKKWFEQQVDHSTESIRDRIRKEIYKSVKNFPSAMKIYPIELGDSWQKLENEDKPLFDKIVGTNSELIEELLIDINKSVTEHNRLMQLNKLTQTISKMRDEKLKSFDLEIESIEKQKSRLKDLIATFTTAIETNQSIINEKKEEIKEIQVDEFTIDEYSLEDSNKPSTLASILTRRISEIKRKVRDYVDENKSVFNDPLAAEINKTIEEIVENKLRDLITELNGKREKVLFFNLGWLARDSKGYHQAAMHKSNLAVKSVNVILDEFRWRAIKTKRDLTKKEMAELEDFNKLYGDKIMKHNNRTFDLDKKIEMIKIKQSEYIKHSEEDLRNSERFMDFINTEYFTLKNKLINTINSDCESEQKLGAFINLYLITQELEKLEGQIV